MPHFRLYVLMAALASGPALAQGSPPAGVVGTTNNPNLSVASVRLDNGVRASRIIGTAVTSDTNEKVGTVDDLIMTQGNKVTVAIVSVGGFIGIGSKLIAVPFEQLKRNGDSLTMAGATKDAVNAMPSFQY